MPTNILMPALSPTMTEGTLARWLKKEGEPIKAGDVIAEIETDKATMEVEAVDEGTLGKILVPDGTAGVKVNDPIAVLVGEGEDASAAPKAEGAPKPPAAAAPQPAAPPASSGTQPPGPKSSGPKSSGNGQAAPAQAGAQSAAQTGNGHAGGERVFASPLARRMAKQAGIDLSKLRGSGPNGRIIRVDIEAAQKGGAAAQAPAQPQPAAPAQPQPAAPAPHPAQAQPAPAAAKPAAPAAAPAPQPARPAPAPITAPHRLVPNTNMRKVIARRLSESKQFVPHFYVTADVELDALLKLRSDLNAKSAKEGPGAFKLSVNDLVIKAAAITLRRVPAVNASYTDDAIVLYDDVDVSVAVSVPDGLITPIIRKADQKGLAAISNEMKDLAARARVGKLKPEEFQGGGFSVSNLGMYGVKQFAAIINPPQGAILAVGAGEQRPVVKNGALAVATVMTCTLSVDHRAVDGALGAEWMAAFKSVVEDPLSLML